MSEPVKITEICDFCNSPDIDRMYTNPEMHVFTGIPVTYEAGEWASCRECGELHEAGRVDELLARVLHIYYGDEESEGRDIVGSQLALIYPQISRQRLPLPTEGAA